MPRKRALIKHIDTVLILGPLSYEAIALPLNHDCTVGGSSHKLKITKKMQEIINNSLHFTTKRIAT